MLNYKKIIALVLSVVMAFTCVPVAFAAPVQRHSASVGWTNPIYEGRVPKVYSFARAPVYYGADPEVTYTTDPDEAAAVLRDGMELRQAQIPVHYSFPGLLPENQEELDAQIGVIASDLWDRVFIETDQPTEGDSLQYCWTSTKAGFSGVSYPAGNYSEGTFTFEVTYYTTLEQEQELTQAVDDLIASFGFTSETTEREKADAIYDWLCANVTYDHKNLEDESYILKFSAYAAMIHKTAVCEGYAVLFYRLAEECGLDARVITGDGGGPHAWNIAKLGEHYYYLDSTWDAGSTPANYEYYLKGHADFYGHTNDPQFDTEEFRERYPIPEMGLTVSTSTEFIENGGEWKFIFSNGMAIITEYLGAEPEITVPANLTITGYLNNVLGDYTFPVHSVAAGVFNQNETVLSITVSEGICQLRPGAIFGCDNLKALYLPSTLEMEDYGFSTITEVPESCYALETLTVAPGNPDIKVVDGVLYTADGSTLLYCPPMNGITELTVPEGVELIGTSAFAYHTTLKKLVLPASVKAIGHWALSGTKALEELQMPGVERIGQYAIGQSAIKSLQIPATLWDLWHGALSEDKIQTITVDPANERFRVENGILIGAGVAHKFALGTQMEHLTLPADVTKIEESAFIDADQLKTVSLPAGLKEIGSGAFEDCDALEHMTLPDGLEELGAHAFVSCDMLVSVVIPQSVQTIGASIHHLGNQADNITIYGAEGSAAQTYAEENGLTFKTIDQWVCAGGHHLEKSVDEDASNQVTDVYTYVCSVCGDHTMRFTKTYSDFGNVTYELETETFTYTGQPHRPKVSNVRDGDGNPLTEGVHFEVEYGPNTNVGEHMQIWLKPLVDDYRGNQYVRFDIQPVDINTMEITVDTPEYEYDTHQKQPEVTVLWNGVALEKYTDFGLLYENNIEPGTAYVIVSGTRNFTGEVRLPFTIKEHSHHFGAWMSADENQHARQCLDHFCLQWEYETHIFDNVCDEECNTCHHLREVPHVFTDTYGDNGSSHYLICDLCGELDPNSFEGHFGGEATCDDKPVCEVCGNEYGAVNEHQLRLYYDEAEHWWGCQNCDYIDWSASHSGGIATCTERATCSHCSQPYGTLREHSLYKANNATHHWDDCRYCDYKGEEVAHSGGEATCMQPANCADCGLPYGEKGDHNYQPDYTYNDRWHYRKCATPGCNMTTDKAEHSGGTATCTERAVCRECQQPYGATLGHDLELIAIPGSLNHYYDCKNCDHTEGGEKHYGGEATCQKQPICELCGLAYGAPVSHSWKSEWVVVGSGHTHECKWCSANDGVRNHTGGRPTCSTLGICTACGLAYGNYGGHIWSTTWDYKSAHGHAHTCLYCAKPGALSVHTGGTATCQARANCAACGTAYGNYGGHTPGPAPTVNTPQICTGCGIELAPMLPNPFLDVPLAQYYATPVLWAVERSITKGLSTTSFGPDAACTRGQIVTFLWRAAGEPEPKSSSNPFWDVPSEQYYYKAVLWAVENGITTGVGAGTFAPESTCTRGQIVTFLHRAKGNPAGGSSNPFYDISASAYYYSPVLWAVENGITTGTSATTFEPEAPCTRGQIVTFLYRAYK